MSRTNSERNPAFGERLKSAMDRRFRTQKDFSRAIDVGDSELSGYLNHGVVPKWPTLVRIKEVLSVSIDWLLTGDEADDPQLEHMRTLMQALDAERQETLLGCARILAGPVDDYFRKTLIDLVLGVEQRVLPGKRLLREYHRRHDSGSTSESSTNE